MIFLVSAELANEGLQSIEPWLDIDHPVWEGAAPLGIFLNADDRDRYADSAFSKVMALLDVPVSTNQTLQDFRAAAMAARIDRLMGDALTARAAAAALRKDYMQLQDNFLAVEAFLNGALAPKFTLAREWRFSGDTTVLNKGQTLQQALPISSAALVGVDLWMVSGKVLVSLIRPDGTDYVSAMALSGTDWQRCQFPAINEPPDDITLHIKAVEDCEIGVSHRSAIVEFGEQPLALRLWKGLSGVRLPTTSPLQPPQKKCFVMPGELPKPEVLSSGSARYLKTENVLMIHTDYYGAANMVFRNTDFDGQVSAYIQNRGPETLEILIAQVSAGADAPIKYCTSVFLAPDAYMQCDVPSDSPETADLIVKIKGQTSLDCLALRGFEID